MNLQSLHPNQRYLFHYRPSDQNNEDAFRANFVKIIINGNNKSLIVDSYHSEKYQHEYVKTIWSIDSNLISKVETLPDIVGDKFVLPDDVLLEIDNYI